MLFIHIKEHPTFFVSCLHLYIIYSKISITPCRLSAAIAILIFLQACKKKKGKDISISETHKRKYNKQKDLVSTIDLLCRNKIQELKWCQWKLNLWYRTHIPLTRFEEMAEIYKHPIPWVLHKNQKEWKKWCTKLWRKSRRDVCHLYRVEWVQNHFILGADGNKIHCCCVLTVSFLDLFAVLLMAATMVQI